MTGKKFAQTRETNAEAAIEKNDIAFVASFVARSWTYAETNCLRDVETKNNSGFTLRSTLMTRHCDNEKKKILSR